MTLTKKRKYLIGGGIALVVIVFFLFSRNNKQPSYESMTAKRQDVIQDVSVTGRVSPSEDADLSFEKAGKISAIYVKVGDAVGKNEILVSQNNADLSSDYNRAKASLENASAQLMQFQAAIDTQKAKLDELVKGTRPEELEVKKSELKFAQQGLDALYLNTMTKLQHAYNLSDDAVRNKTSGMFTGSKSSGFSINFTACDQAAENQAESGRLASEGELDRWLGELNVLGREAQNLEGALSLAKDHLVIFQDFLIQASLALSTGCALQDSSLDTSRTNINSARTNVNTAMSNINDHVDDLKTQKITVQKLENEFALKLAGSTPEQISAQAFQVRQAEANKLAQEAIVRQQAASLQNISAQIAKTIIRSPIAGIVAKQEAKLGEIVSAGTSLVSVISEKQYEIEANIPEVDIAKIRPGNQATITLDAYANDVTFAAKVGFIDPAETIIDGVPTYKVTLQFIQEDARIRSGMTANVIILANQKTNVLAVPQRAVIQKNNHHIIRVITGETMRNGLPQYEERKVTLGLRGSDGSIEVIEGLNEGEKVITYFKEK